MHAVARIGRDADGDHVLDAGFACSGDDFGAVVVELGLIEMGVSIEELHLGLGAGDWAGDCVEQASGCEQVDIRHVAITMPVSAPTSVAPNCVNDTTPGISGIVLPSANSQYAMIIAKSAVQKAIADQQPFGRTPIHEQRYKSVGNTAADNVRPPTMSTAMKKSGPKKLGGAGWR